MGGAPVHFHLAITMSDLRHIPIRDEMNIAVAQPQKQSIG